MTWYSCIATLGPIGYLPARGSVATVLTVPLLCLLKMPGLPVWFYPMACLVIGIIALYITRKTLRYLNRYDDPSEIVIDEVIGFLVTFLHVEYTMQSIVLGLVLFRFFDIFKIAGIAYVERLAGEWGIVLDDVCAGLLSNLIMRLLL